ncbi:hypothetical protein EV175_001979 [Coemansia sp. RSA 1933]|nr:hypothetical protein EV175_001979 [Coemansia sp. RSA 1933]
MKLAGFKRLLAAVATLQATVLAKNTITTTTSTSTSIAKDSTVSKRDVTVNDVLNYKSALLLIDGQETSCECALIDSGAGFVAASCLEFSGSKVDMSSTYELAIKTGRGSSPTTTQTITSITVHPGYNSASLVNNLAVVQFGDQSDISWQNYIGIDPSEWSSLYFIRRSLENVPSLTWNDVIAYSSTDTPDLCTNASMAYASNPNDFLCNYAATLSIMNQECKVPYGTVYAAIQPSDIAIVALHSHSAVYGESMCSKDTKLHYYTLLRNYLAWAATTINRAIGGFALNSSYTFSPDSSYSMKSASSNTVNGVDVFYGNLYAQEPADASLSAAIYNSQGVQSSASTNGASSTPTPTSSSSNSGSANSSETSSKSESSNTSNTSSHSKTSSDSATDSNSEIGELSDDSSNDETDSDASSDSSSDDGSSSGKSGGVSAIAIIIPVVIVLLIIGGAGIVWYVRRRRRKIEEQTNALHNANNDDDDDITPMHHPNGSHSSFMNYYNNQDGYGQQNMPPMPPVPPQHQQNTMSQYTTNSHMFTQPHTARNTHYDMNL